MRERDYTQVAVVLIILFSIAVRLFALFLVESIDDPKTWEYEVIANNFLEGKGFCYMAFDTIYRNSSMVLYPLICAIVYYFSNHSFLAVKILQILLSVFNCILIYCIAKRLFGKKAGLIALILMSFHPGLIVYSIKMHSLVLGTFLFTLSIYFLIFIIEGRKILKNSFLAGLSIGLALLTRATIGMFIPIALFIIFLNMKRLHKKAVRSVLYILTGILLILSPLIIRNYLVFHRVVLLPTSSGFNFWVGNNPYSIGTAGTLNGKTVLRSTPESFRQEVTGLDEFEQNRFFYNDAKDFIKNNPWSALSLFVRKLSYFWWFTPTQGMDYPKAWRMIYRLYYSVALFCAILAIFMGIFRIPRQKRQALYMIILFLVAISVAQALYYVDGRHRWTVEPLMLIFSAVGVDIIWSKIKCLRIRT